jgi:hypothetical protein
MNRRTLLKKLDLCGMMLELVNIHLEANGIKAATGTIPVVPWTAPAPA